MSNKPVLQHCAICEREKELHNGVTSRKYTQSRHATSPLLELHDHTLRHRYGDLPGNKHDDYFTQVTEPQWLRRGNLKESDLVCKRHLAILMRGVDRGCEGGCCSPLHRGARLCKPANLKSIPPTWRRRFVNHPKIKDEDKALMLLCWDCYKKHMDRMSKYGDPMGRSFGNRRSIQRSNSLVDTTHDTNILQAMKRYKSLDKLDSCDTSPVSTSPINGANVPSRKTSSSSNSPKILVESPGNERDTKASPSRRPSRGRKMNKGKRSPSPPNNISPVRTSVVHSRRRHSPHKRSKSPVIQRSSFTTALCAVTQSSPDLVLSTRGMKTGVTYASSFHAGDIVSEAIEGSRPAPLPPNGLFSPRSDRSNDIIDVFGTRKPKSPERKSDEPDTGQQPTSVVSQPATFNHTNVISSTDTTILQDQNQALQQVECGVDPQCEDSITSADEMAAIFGDENSGPTSEVCNKSYLNSSIEDMEAIEEPQFLEQNGSGNIEPQHQHEGSGSSSDKTVDTQIASGLYGSTTSQKNKINDIITMEKESWIDDYDRNAQKFDDSRDVAERSDRRNGISTSQEHEENDANNLYQHIPDSFSPSDFKNSLFVSPRKKTLEESPPSVSSSILNYSLSPQSFRRLESIKLSFSEETIVDNECQTSTLNSSDDVRDISHPLRNHVFMKIPRDLRSGLSSFQRIPAEDIVMFPDTISFLDGLTQSVGEGLSMYSKDEIQLLNVNLRKEDNMSAHRTSEFGGKQLVVRRGQAFEIELEMNEDYDIRKPNIMVELLAGEHPRVSNGTHILLSLQSNEQATLSYGPRHGSTWSGRLVKAREKSVTLSITSPPACPIGCYAICIQIENEGKRSRWNCSSEDDRSLIVLFNPWCIDDAIFMSSQADRSEYVVSDTGCIYTGNTSNIFHFPWIFGQYEDEVLQACLQLLESCNLSNSQLGDPVAVTTALCRCIAEAVTRESATQKVGKRKREASSDTVDILLRYLHSGILSVPDDNITSTALLVTVFRCLGFPTRPVTCFNCAIETDRPMVVNTHYNEDGHLLDFLNTDKIWPSYCWAGVWMSRVDLPPGFGGWQAMRASGHPHASCGPTPVYGIKKGQTSCSEGTRTYFTALNSDEKHWKVSNDGNMCQFRTDKNVTGSSVITKCVGSQDPQDITKLYKFTTNSEENKLAIHTAQMHCGIHGCYVEAREGNEVTMALSTDPTVINFGNDVDIVTKITNNGHSVRHLTINIDGTILSQDGSTISKLLRETILAEVLTRESVDIPVKINLSSCLHKLAHSCHLAFTAFATVRENASCQLVSKCFAGIKYPEVEIQLHGEFKVGGEVTISSKLRNPLPHVLRNAKMSLVTNGLNPLNIAAKTGKSVAPWQTFKTDRVYRCQRSGKHTIVAIFTSDHLNGPVGMQEIEVT